MSNNVSTSSSSLLQFLLIIIIIKLILLKIRVRTLKFQIYEWQRVTDSDVFRPNLAQVRWRSAVRFVYIKNNDISERWLFLSNNLPFKKYNI
jgi:hypothetical protein